MSFKSRLKKLEALPVKRHNFINSMVEISPDQAQKIYNEVMNGSHPPLFIMTNKGKAPIIELTDAEIRRTYTAYANGNLEIITEKEV